MASIHSVAVHTRSSSEEKVALFRSLFRGRENVYPRRLSNPSAYRSDRRKDALLQEGGYYVLRFLTEDLGKHLDATLDAILRAISHLRRKT